MAGSVFKIRVFEGKPVKVAGKKPKWYYETIARNGKVLSVSQGYSRRNDATRLARRAYPGVKIKFDV